VDFPFFSTESATPVKVLVMPRVFCRVHYSSGEESEEMGQWVDFRTLPRIGEKVAFIPGDDWSPEVLDVVHWPHDDVIVLHFSLDVELFRRDCQDKSFMAMLVEHFSSDFLVPLDEDTYFPSEA
jgi:hypothetical protein